MLDKLISLLDCWFKISDRIETRNREKEFDYFSEGHIVDEWTRFSHCGNIYTYSMFTPVHCVMMCLFRVYETNNLPIYGVKTNVQEIDMRSGTLNVDIQTTRPGLLIGKEGEHIKKLGEELKKIFNVSSVNVRLEEITNVHQPIENY